METQKIADRKTVILSLRHGDAEIWQHMNRPNPQVENNMEIGET